VIRALRLACLACSLLIVMYAAVRWGGWWRVEAVRISPTRFVATEQLTGILLGANVLRLHPGEMRGRIPHDPRILEMRIRVRPLRKRVEVEIKEREPAVQVQLHGGTAVWVDREGVILAPAADPAVVGARMEGDRVSREAVAAAQAVARLDAGLRARFPTFDISDPTSVTAKGDGSPTLLLGKVSQLGDRLAILGELWAQGLLARYATVDFRMSDEVILKRRR